MVTFVPVLQRSHHFSYLKFTFLLIFILHYEIQEETKTYLQYFQRDLRFCNDCFQQHVSHCKTFFNTIEDDTSSPLQNILNLLPKNSKRATNFLKQKNKHKNYTQSQKIIAKYVAHQNLESLLTPPNLQQLKELFFDSTRLDGLQFCEAKRINRFVKYLKQHTGNSTLSIWLHLILNIEPILMPHLETLGYPVPKTFAVCGFTLYQAYAGKALIYYYNADFELKLRIAKQILEAAIKFSKGFAGFRIYITDLSSDNIVFDERTQQLSFVDLDTVLIVDSKAKHLERNSTHKHIYIDCDNCFAYSQQDICNHGLSDINLYSACQLLRENLKREREFGFLYPIPNDISKTYPNLEDLLDNCVDCSDVRCINRFAATLDLIKLFNVILGNFYFTL